MKGVCIVNNYNGS
jgi:hypothetical protein